MISLCRIIAADVKAVTPFPAFRCSIMDGKLSANKNKWIKTPAGIFSLIMIVYV